MAEIINKFDLITDDVENWIVINGQEYRYPDLKSAFIKGIEMVNNGKHQLNIKIDNEGSSPADYAKKKRNLYVGDLGYAYDLCARQLKLKLAKAPKREKSYNELLMLMHGNIVHGEAVKYIEIGLDNYWEIVGVEESVQGLGLRGRYDMKIEGQRGEQVIIDFKTSRGKNFDYLDRDGCKPEPKAQVRGYIQIDQADFGVVFYIDREGQNGIREFPVMPNKVDPLIKILKFIKENDQPILKPNIRVRKNKSDNSIYISQPWQCNYCDFLDVSCPSALKPSWRNITGIVAKEDDQGNIYAYEKQYEELLPTIRKVLGGE